MATKMPKPTAKVAAMPTTPPPPKLKTLFRSAQRRLESSLFGADVVTHPGEKGCASENDWRSFLRTHLPSRYAADSAFVVDIDGNQSEQIDVVIYDRHFTPLLLDQSGVRFVLAESVYAIFEVKQVLDKSHMAYASQKAASVRALRRTSGAFNDGGETRAAKKAGPIIAGVLTSRTLWKPPFGKPFSAALASGGVGVLDLGIALQQGAFERSAGGVLRTVSADASLMFLVFALMRRLLEVGTVPAPAWGEYEKAILDG